MLVKIKAMAQARQAVTQKEVELDGIATVEQVLGKLGLSGSSPFIYAVNGRIAGLEQTLNNGDVLQIIPITGGG